MSAGRGNGQDDQPTGVALPAGDEDGGAPEPASAPETTGAPADEAGLVEAAEPEPTPEAIEALREERDTLRDQLLRRRADFENYRKRVERDREAVEQEATAAAFRGLLSTLDSLERALAASGDIGALRRGVELTQRELLNFLDQSGVAVLNPLGQRFDPTRHQALVHEPAPGFEEGAIAEVYRKGYTYRDRLLRPALVKVAKSGGSTPGDGAEDEALEDAGDVN
jgi:molecular chaperone GrpE